MSSRPRNIGLGDLMKYRFPVTAIASILHRISGLLLFIAVPFLLWALSCSLQSPHSFAQVHQFFQLPIMKFVVWAVGSALIYHFLAGVKHLFMDIGYFESLCSGKLASWVVILVSVILMVGLGVCLW